MFRFLNKRLCVVLLCTLAPAASQPSGHVAASGVIRTVSTQTPQGDFVEGQLDWTDGVLIVTGEGVAPESITNPVQARLLGFRAAKVTAYRKLLSRRWRSGGRTHDSEYVDGCQ